MWSNEYNTEYGYDKYENSDEITAYQIKNKKSIDSISTSDAL